MDWTRRNWMKLGTLLLGIGWGFQTRKAEGTTRSSPGSTRSEEREYPAKGGDEQHMCKQSQIVTSNVINRVLNIKIGNRRGTGFTIEVDGRQYLITAKHVTGEEKVGWIEIEQEKWVGLDVKTVGIGGIGRDVAVLAADRKLTTAHEIDIGSNGITIGQDIRFLGFPSGLRMGYVSGYKGKEIPMVKAGILSGISRIEKERQGGRRLWVDGHNNDGFSGGPIVFKTAGGTEGVLRNPGK